MLPKTKTEGMRNASLARKFAMEEENSKREEAEKQKADEEENIKREEAEKRSLQAAAAAAKVCVCLCVSVCKEGEKKTRGGGKDVLVSSF